MKVFCAASSGIWMKTFVPMKRFSMLGKRKIWKVNGKWEKIVFEFFQDFPVSLHNCCRICCPQFPAQSSSRRVLNKWRGRKLKFNYPNGSINHVWVILIVSAVGQKLAKPPQVKVYIVFIFNSISDKNWVRIDVFHVHIKLFKVKCWRIKRFKLW